MQTDEVDFEFTSNTLNTPSLVTPNIVLNAQTLRSTFNTINTNVSTNDKHSTMSNSTTTSESSSTTSSADVKVLKIEDALKQSFGDSRQPTPSPFQHISSTNVFTLDKPITVITTDDGTTIEIPSTADVVKELEALTNVNPFHFPMKTSLNDTNERETNGMNSDNIRYDSPPILNMGVIVSPKKKFLIRSQSHTEPTSPIQNNNNLSHSQKTNHDSSSISNTQNGLDDENSMDDSGNTHFTRISDVPTITSHSNNINGNNNNNQQFKSMMDNGNEHNLNVQLRMEHNGVSHPMMKRQQQQQQLVINNINHNKRTFQQTNNGNNIPSITKASTIIIPQASLNEVTSSDLSTHVKRQRTVPMPVNTSTAVNFRSSFPASSSSSTATHILPTTSTATPTNSSNVNAGSDDHRKKQIRDSNREAARRCRERRRQYIEQLEGTLEQHKLQLKQLGEKLARVDRENTQLRAILSETKILHPASRLSVNESHVDYANVMAATAMDLNSDSHHQTDGGSLQRNYMNRNNL